MYNLFVFLSLLNLNLDSFTLEGQWKVVDWTYISYVGRSLDEKERQEMNSSLNDLILDFSTDNTLSTNKPETFKFLENKKYTLSDYNGVVLQDHVFPILTKGKHRFLLLSNVMLEIEKIKTYDGASIVINELPPLAHKKLKKESVVDKKTAANIYAIDDVDVPPSLKSVQFDEDCLVYCLEDAFNSNTTYFINFSEVGRDTTYWVEFIVDKKNEIRIVDVKSKQNKPRKKGTFRTATVTWGNPEEEEPFSVKTKLTEIEKNLVSSILHFQDDIVAGIKNGKKVNTTITLKIRLISKHGDTKN